MQTCLIAKDIMTFILTTMTSDLLCNWNSNIIGKKKEAFEKVFKLSDSFIFHSVKS